MKVAIIEIGGSHDECIYSQIKILKSVEGIHLTLICNDSLKENVKYFDLVDKKVFVQLRSGYKQWGDVCRLWRFCKKEGFNKIIFNTAHGSPVSRLLLFPFNKLTKFYGVLHQPKKTITSHTQKKISKKVAHYFVLDNYLESVVGRKDKNKFTVSSFYPVFFPDYPEQEVKKENNEIWIGIPGGVELSRRDYGALFDSIQKYGINKNIKILLLGGYAYCYK
jgi:ADP-heptose:LPS heptosyltransferase